ncbi:hypothetical protein U1Q18_030256 [Sarracenia purpurea var. burkii]
MTSSIPKSSKLWPAIRLPPLIGDFSVISSLANSSTAISPESSLVVIKKNFETYLTPILLSASSAHCNARTLCVSSIKFSLFAIVVKIGVRVEALAARV